MLPKDNDCHYLPIVMHTSDGSGLISKTNIVYHVLYLQRTIYTIKLHYFKDHIHTKVWKIIYAVIAQQVIMQLYICILS